MIFGAAAAVLIIAVLYLGRQLTTLEKTVEDLQDRR